MLIVKNKRYLRKHVVGGAGIFDNVSNFFKRLSSSGISRSVASNISKAAASGRDFVSSDIGKHTINAAKTVGKELATSAISTAKDIAIDKGKQLIAKARPEPKPELRPEPQASSRQPRSQLTPESKEILENLVRRIAQPPETSSPSPAETAANLNRLLAGQGLKTNLKNKANRSKAVRIQDMVRTLNGGGLKLA